MKGGKPFTRSNGFSDLQKQAEKQGWRVTVRGNQHLRWESPAGAVVFSAATPSDHKAIHRHRTLLKQNGLKLPDKKTGRLPN